MTHPAFLFPLSSSLRSSSIAFTKNLLARASRVFRSNHPSSRIVLDRKGCEYSCWISNPFFRAISGDDSQLRDALSLLKFLFVFLFVKSVSSAALFLDEERKIPSPSSLSVSSGSRKRNNIPQRGIRLIGYEIRASRSRITSFPVNFIRKLCLRFFPCFTYFPC